MVDAISAPSRGHVVINTVFNSIQSEILTAETVKLKKLKNNGQSLKSFAVVIRMSNFSATPGMRVTTLQSSICRQALKQNIIISHWLLSKIHFTIPSKYSGLGNFKFHCQFYTRVKEVMNLKF